MKKTKADKNTKSVSKIHRKGDHERMQEIRQDIHEQNYSYEQLKFKT